MENNKLHSKKCFLLFSIVFSFSVFVLLFLMFEKIPNIYIDDTMYSDWTKHGLSYFIEKNIWHINNFNGRTFIHLCLEFVLIFKQHLYAILIPTFIFVSAFLTTKLVNKNMPLPYRFFASGICELLFLLLDYRYITYGIMWRAAGFNYVFPMFLVILSYYLFVQSFENKKLSILAYILLFISGSSQEQYGMFLIGLIILRSIFEFASTKKICRKNIIGFICSAIGYLTIYLSPGTMNRFFIEGAGSKVGFFEKLWSGLLESISFFNGSYGPTVVTILIMLFFGILPLLDKRYSKLLYICCVCGILNFFCFNLNNKIIFTLIFIIFAAVVCIAFLKNKDTRTYGILSVCGFGTLIMMCVAEGSVGYRTTIPVMFALFLIISSILSEIVAYSGRKLFSYLMICCISIGGFVNYVNLYNGYTSAKIYTDDLECQINEVDKTKNININFDDILYDSRYKYRCETVVDSMRLDLIRQYKDIPTDTKFTFTSEKYNVSNMCYNNIYSPAPIITDSSGNRLVSILGIQCFVDNNNAYTVDYENSSIYIINDSKNTKYVFYTNKTLSSIVDNKETIKKENVNVSGIETLNAGTLLYIPIDDFCNWTNTEYHYDDTSNTFVFEDLR